MSTFAIDDKVNTLRGESRERKLWPDRNAEQVIHLNRESNQLRKIRLKKIENSSTSNSTVIQCTRSSALKDATTIASSSVPSFFHTDTKRALYELSVLTYH